MASRNYDWKRELKREHLSDSDDDFYPECPPNFVKYRPDMTIDDEDKRRLDAMTQFEREKEFDRRIQDYDMQQIRRHIYEKSRLRKRNQESFKKKRLDGPVTTNTDIDSGPVLVIDEETEPSTTTAEVKPEQMDDNVLIVDEVFTSDLEDGELSSTSCSSANSSRSSSPDRVASEKVTTMEQLARARLSRSDLAQFCHAPFFKPYAVGCLVRVCTDADTDFVEETEEFGSAHIYQVFKILDIIESDHAEAYDLEKTRTNALLRLKYGSDEGNYPMNLVSNCAITDDEFRHWTGHNSHLVSLHDVEKKEHDIKEMKSREITESDVSHMLERKRRFRKFEGPNADEKRQLTREIEMATEAGEMDVVVRCRTKLNALIEREKNSQDNGNSGSPAPPAAVTTPRVLNLNLMKPRKPVVKMKLEDLDDTPFIRKSGRVKIDKERKNRSPSPTTAKNNNEPLQLIPVTIPEGLEHPVYMYTYEEVKAELESLSARHLGPIPAFPVNIAREEPKDESMTN